MTPRVSVIIPTFNRTKLLKRALQSVEKQTHRNLEILVIDDHSTEDIQGLIDSLKSDLPIRRLESHGRGVSAARNTGLRASKTPLVAFLDSDDEWLPTKIQKQISYLEDHPEINLVHTEETWLRNGSLVTKARKHKKSGGRIFDQCVKLCLIAPSSVLFRKSLVDQVGFFDESFPVCEDFDWWLRITAGQEVGYLPEELTIKHGGHEDQLSLKYHSMDLWRIRALRKHLDQSHLSTAENLVLKESLREKAGILMKGFQKYQKFDSLDEIAPYLSSDFCPRLAP